VDQDSDVFVCNCLSNVYIDPKQCKLICCPGSVVIRLEDKLVIIASLLKLCPFRQTRETLRFDWSLELKFRVRHSNATHRSIGSVHKLGLIRTYLEVFELHY
jgi:hypothetical protein